MPVSVGGRHRVLGGIAARVSSRVYSSVSVGNQVVVIRGRNSDAGCRGI